MNVGSRNLFGEKASNPYVTDGLVAMWDAEWNSGFGVHIPDATLWKDLVGGFGDFIVPNASWSNNSLLLDSMTELATDDKKLLAVDQIECVAKWDKLGVWTDNSFIDFKLTTAPRRAIRWIGGGSGRYWEGIGNLSEHFTSNGFSNDPAASTYITTASLSVSKNALRINNKTCQHNSVAVVFGVEDHSAIAIQDGNLSTHYFCIRLYNKELTAEELDHNYQIDTIRFGLEK